MPNVGIKRYSYKPNENSYADFIVTLDKLLRFYSKSDYWRLGCPFSSYRDKSKDYLYNDLNGGNTYWYVHHYQSTDILLKHFRINKRIAVDIYTKPKHIVLRRFSGKVKVYPFNNSDDFKYADVEDTFDVQIMPITVKQYNKLKQLEQPFNYKLNYLPK